MVSYFRDDDERALGATGDLPDEPIFPDDEGGLRCAIAIVKGKLVIDFGKPIKWVGLDRQSVEDFVSILQDQMNYSCINTRVS